MQTAILELVFLFYYVSLLQRGVVAATPAKDIHNGPCFFWTNAFYFNGKCYKYFSDEVLTWEDSQSACRRHSSTGRLAEPLTQRDRKMLKENTKHISGADGWIGGMAEDKIPGIMFTWAHNGTNVNGIVPLSNSETRCLHQMDNVIRHGQCNDARFYYCEQEVSNACHLMDGYEYYRGKCLKYETTENTFTMAKDGCQAMDAMLAEPQDEEFMTYIKEMLFEVQGTAWLGAKREHGNTMKWVTSGTSVNGVSNHQQPGDLCLAMKYDDASMRPSSLQCTGKMKNICQKEIGNPCEMFVPDGVYSEGYCFKFFNQPSTFQRAKISCAAMDGFIAELTTKTIEDLVTNLLIKDSNEKNVCSQGSYRSSWIGMFRNEKDDSSRWTMEGLPVDRPRWPNWHNMYQHRHCAVINGLGHFVQKNCDDKYIFVCQKAITTTDLKQRYIAPLKFDLLGNVDSPNTASDNPLKKVYFSVTTSLTTGLVQLFIKTVRHNREILRNDHKTVSFDRAHHFYIGQEEDANVIEIVSSNHVTVTLYRAIERDIASTLVFASLSNNYPWLYKQPYWIPALADEDGDCELVVTAIETGETTVHFDKLVEIDTKAMEQYESTHYQYKDIKGFKLTSDKNIAVFALRMNPNRGMTMKQLLPSSIHVTKELIALPSTFQDANNITKLGELRFASILEGNTILVPFSSPVKYKGLDSSIAGQTYQKYLDGDSFMDMAVIKFNGTPETISPSYPASGVFTIQSGDGEFSMSQKFKIEHPTFKNKHAICDMVLIPKQFWSSHYVGSLPVHWLPDMIQFIYLYLVLEAGLEDGIFVNQKQMPFQCSPVEGLQLSGCQGYLDKGDFENGGSVAIKMEKPFGAYVMLITATGLSCHPLGIWWTPREGKSPIDPNSALPPLPRIAEISTTTTQPSETNKNTAQTTTTTTTTVNETTEPCPTISQEKYVEPVTDQTKCKPPIIKYVNLTVKETEELVEELVQEIQQELVVNKSSTNFYRRSKTSAPDIRYSSKVIGTVGVVVFSVEVAIIVVPDLLIAWSKN